MSIPTNSCSFKLKMKTLNIFFENEYIDNDKYTQLYNEIINNTTKEQLINEIIQTTSKYTSCFVCMTQESTYFNTKCGHMMLCDICTSVAQDRYKIKSCPLCKENIGDLVKLYK